MNSFAWWRRSWRGPDHVAQLGGPGLPAVRGRAGPRYWSDWVTVAGRHGDPAAYHAIERAVRRGAVHRRWYRRAPGGCQPAPRRGAVVLRWFRGGHAHDPRRDGAALARVHGRDTAASSGVDLRLRRGPNARGSLGAACGSVATAAGNATCDDWTALERDGRFRSARTGVVAGARRCRDVLAVGA